MGAHTGEAEWELAECARASGAGLEHPLSSSFPPARLQATKGNRAPEAAPAHRVSAAAADLSNNEPGSPPLAWFGHDVSRERASAAAAALPGEGGDAGDVGAEEEADGEGSDDELVETWSGSDDDDSDGEAVLGGEEEGGFAAPSAEPEDARLRSMKLFARGAASRLRGGEGGGGGDSSNDKAVQAPSAAPAGRSGAAPAPTPAAPPPTRRRGALFGEVDLAERLLQPVQQPAARGMTVAAAAASLEPSISRAAQGTGGATGPATSHRRRRSSPEPSVSPVSNDAAAASSGDRRHRPSAKKTSSRIGRPPSAPAPDTPKRDIIKEARARGLPHRDRATAVEESNGAGTGGSIDVRPTKAILVERVRLYDELGRKAAEPEIAALSDTGVRERLRELGETPWEGGVADLQRSQLRLVLLELAAGRSLRLRLPLAKGGARPPTDGEAGGEA